MRERKKYHRKKKWGTVEENARSKFRDPKVKKTVSKKEIPGNPEQEKKIWEKEILKSWTKKKIWKKIWGKSLTKKNLRKKQIGEKFWTKKRNRK